MKLSKPKKKTAAVVQDRARIKKAAPVSEMQQLRNQVKAIETEQRRQLEENDKRFEDLEAFRSRVSPILVSTQPGKDVGTL
jgi:predicted nucleic acid binding AN1-type Zn finger protein